MKKHPPLIMLIASIISIFSWSTPLVGAQAENTISAPFPDVTQDNNQEAITKLKTYGIIQGYPDGEYKPKITMNRAEFMKVLIGSITQNPQGQDCFLDVKKEWFAPYICEGKKRGIIQGDDTDPRYFRPADEIKFSEASKIIAKTYNLQNEQNNASTWFASSVAALENRKDIPLSVEIFDQPISRDEMAEMVWRLKDNVTDKASRTYDEINGDNLVKADSCADLQGRYVEAYRNMYGSGGEGPLPPRLMDEMPATAPTAGMPSPTPVMAPQEKTANDRNYSTTDLQVAGVDEADVIKNDDKYIYLVKGNTIRIVEAYPAENMKELVSLTLGDDSKDKSFYPTEMYVNGDTLTVVGSSSLMMPMSSTTAKIAAPYNPYQPRTKVYILDITDRTKPKVTRSIEFDGNYSTSRRIGDTLYMVMNESPVFIPYYQLERRDSEIKPNEILPMMNDSVKGQDEVMASCNQILIFPKPKTTNFLITAAVPLKDNSKQVVRSVVMGNTENTYVSTNNLYVASTDWSGGYYEPSPAETTMVYKFALGDGTLSYQAENKVPGHVLNQFSMDEKDGNLRITTSKNKKDGSLDGNNLYILDKDMKVTGKLENLAPGEEIYATRFMGDRAYLVTYKTIDPLFVLDVKDPANPKVLGKLEIPGYSNYLHPYDENHILGFGKDVDENIDADKVHSPDAIYYTAVQGMKIGLFDVTDVNHPKEMFKEVIGNSGTDSELLTNHKALLFDKEKELLAFPVSVNEIPDDQQCSTHTYSTCPSTCHKMCMPSVCNYENGVKVCTADCDGANSCAAQDPYQASKPVFVGAYVYKLNLQDGFKLQGKITHLNDQEQQQLKDDGYNSNYEKTIQRLLYIGENLYSVSQGMIKANNLNDLQEKKNITLAGSMENAFPGIVMPY